jgi:hypothetical protein
LSNSIVKATRTCESSAGKGSLDAAYTLTVDKVTIAFGDEERDAPRLVT